MSDVKSSAEKTGLARYSVVLLREVAREHSHVVVVWFACMIGGYTLFLEVLGKIWNRFVIVPDVSVGVIFFCCIFLVVAWADYSGKRRNNEDHNSL